MKNQTNRKSAVTVTHIGRTVDARAKPAAAAEDHESRTTTMPKRSDRLHQCVLCCVLCALAHYYILSTWRESHKQSKRGEITEIIFIFTWKLPFESIQFIISRTRSLTFLMISFQQFPDTLNFFLPLLLFSALPCHSRANLKLPSFRLLAELRRVYTQLILELKTLCRKRRERKK